MWQFPVKFRWNRDDPGPDKPPVLRPLDDIGKTWTIQGRVPVNDNEFDGKPVPVTLFVQRIDAKLCPQQWIPPVIVIAGDYNHAQIGGILGHFYIPMMNNSPVDFNKL